MKQIVIVRHAKSSWKDFSLRDIERPLNKRGKRDAPIMAEHLEKSGFMPGTIISSPSQRTQDTVAYFLESYKMKTSDVVYDKRLYHGSEHDFINAMFAIPDEVDNVMMLGHNPGITYIANLCTDEMIDNVPTSGILVIEMDIDHWVDADWNKASLKHFYYPKMFV